jgi:hypothetical protein
MYLFKNLIFNNYLLDEYFAQAGLGFVFITAVKPIHLSVLVLFVILCNLLIFFPS